MRRLAAEEFLQAGRNAILLDVRSPDEYAHAHIPGAVSFPLFTDEERKIVGTAYKQESRENAIKIGLDYFGPKMRKMVEEVEALVAAKRQATESDEGKSQSVEGSLAPGNSVFIYCWRGGMRSGAVAWLLGLYGFNVTVLAGGYKAFRNYVLKTFEQPYPFKIVGGYTGSGKTEVLHQLKRAGEKIIDLEGLALHKGSAFGNINMLPQPTQEMFENLLGCELMAVHNNRDHSNTNSLNQAGAIWLEDESQRIGRVNIPNAVWNTMRNSPVYFLEIPFDERLDHIEAEYGRCDKEKLSAAIERIRKRLGGLETKNALEFLHEGNLRDCFRILLHYYDKQYAKALHAREDLARFLTKIPCKTVTDENAAIVSPA